MIKSHMWYSHDTVDRLDNLDAMHSVPRPSSSRKSFASYADDATGLFLHASQLTILMKTTFAQGGGKNEVVEQTQTSSKEKGDTESTVFSQC